MNFFPKSGDIAHLSLLLDNYQRQDKRERDRERERQDRITKLNKKGWLSELEALSLSIDSCVLNCSFIYPVVFVLAQ